MSWFFRISGAIFVLFAVIIVGGALLPATQTLERSAVLDADISAVFDRIDDLSTHPSWSHAVPGEAAIAYGERVGTGASAAWENGATVGIAEIVQSLPPDLVVVSIQADADISVLTYALQDEGRRTLIVAQEDRELGGFPWLDRVAAKLREGSRADALQGSLERLAATLPEE